MLFPGAVPIVTTEASSRGTGGKGGLSILTGLVIGADDTNRGNLQRARQLCENARP